MPPICQPFLHPLHARLSHCVVCLFALVVLVGQVHAGIIDIDNTELENLLKQGIPLIDVRTEPEWSDTGVIPRSHLMTFFDERGRYDAPGWLAKLKPLAKPDSPVILICRTGNRTRMISQFLVSEAGYKTVYNVKLGIKGWIREKRPVEPYR